QDFIDGLFIFQTGLLATSANSGFLPFFVLQGNDLAATLLLGDGIFFVESQVKIGAFEVGVGLVNGSALDGRRIRLESRDFEVGFEDIGVALGSTFLFLFIHWQQIAAVVQSQFELAVRIDFGLLGRRFFIQA